MTRKSKEAAPDCEHTPPKKKARKVNLSDSNRASTASIQNTEKTFTSLARGEHESTNHMASHLHKKHIDKSTDTKKSQDHCFEKQFPVEKTDDSSNDNGAYDPEKCLSEPVDYQNECHKINVSTHEDCKSSSISCKVGDTASKVETQCMKDILVREDDTGPFIFCKNGDIASKGETQFKKDISVLGDETGPLISCKVGDTASKVETQYTKDISVLKDDTGPSISCKVGDIASKAETQCKKDISVLEDDTGPWMGFSLDEIEFPLITFRELEEILAFPEAESAVNSLLTDYSLDIGTQNPNSAEDNCNPFTETPDGFITFDKPEMSDKFFPD